MQHALTLFDYAQDVPLPIQSMLVNEEGDVSFFTFFLPKTGLKLSQIRKNREEFAKIFASKVSVNDFKSHVAAFELEPHVEYSVYDLDIPQLKIKPDNEIHGKKILTKLMAGVINNELSPWQSLVSNASVVYNEIERRGIYHGYKKVSPKYELSTFTGRSKTKGFNVQGTTDEFDLRLAYSELCYFVHLDWIAADLRMASHLSKDPVMEKSFIDSDPYTEVSKFLNHKDFDRDRCKKDLMKSVYSIAVNDPILEYFPVFRDWMSDKLDFMRANNYLESIMGRRFNLTSGKDLRVFNSQLQGSVVHAMQAALIRIWDEFPKNLFTEVHDSIVLCCRVEELEYLIRKTTEIMVNPLFGWVDDPPRMPVKVSVGDHWKRWKFLRVYR